MVSSTLCVEGVSDKPETAVSLVFSKPLLGLFFMPTNIKQTKILNRELYNTKRAK